MFYAIEKSGSRYTIKAVYGQHLIPSGCKRVYRSEAPALKDARDLGINVSLIGDLWEILKYSRENGHMQ